MSITSDLLFAYLREIFYATPDAKLEIEKLEEDYVLLAKGLVFFAQCFSEYNEFADALARGDLSVPAPPVENELTAPLKSLHASLKHLTWQSKQVAKGDYKQRVDFMGEFADSFNTMIEQLADRQRKLEDEIEASRKKAHAMEMSNKLLRNITQYIPQQIFVVSEAGHEVLLMNDMAKLELVNNPDYLTMLMGMIPVCNKLNGTYHHGIQFEHAGAERYLAVNTYTIVWEGKNALAMVINDVSDEKKQLKELEEQAYRDAMTHCYNRFYGMVTLNDWVNEKKRFVLVFVDLDNLKYVNDVHGHTEGDEYITRVSCHLESFSRDAFVCRIGGDEFMLLAPDIGYGEAASRMAEISNAICNDEYINGKDYSYSISLGIVAVGVDNELPSSSILSAADERMYEHKRAQKKERLSS